MSIAFGAALGGIVMEQSGVGSGKGLTPVREQCEDVEGSGVGDFDGNEAARGAFVKRERL